MRQEVVDRYLADPAAFTLLEERGLVWDKDDRKKSGRFLHLPLHAPNPMSTTLQSRRFDSVIARLRELNFLGYDIHVCPNPLSFGRRCEQTVRGVRGVVLAGGGKDKPKWLDWLAHDLQHALAAVDSGSVLQIAMRIPPIRNRQCIEKWKYLPGPDDDTTVEWPRFHQIADQVERFAQRDGLHPDQGALHDFAGLVRCPGFVDALTGQQVRLLHPVVVGDSAVEPTVVADGSLARGPASLVAPTSGADPNPEDRPAPSKPRRNGPAAPSRRRIPPPCIGQPQDIRFYCKVDAAKVLSPAFRQYADHANYIQHRILMGRMLGDLDETGGHTLLKSDYLRRVIHAQLLKPLLEEMRAVGLIERDDHYVIGQKSYGYRITDPHAGARTLRVDCRRTRLSSRILALRHEDFAHYKRVHKHLFQWLGRLGLDRLLADQVIDQTDFTGAGLPVQETRDIHHLAV
jgi:hypothetical protein